VLLQVLLLLVDWDVPWRRRPVRVVLHCHALASGCQGWPSLPRCDWAALVWGP